MSNRIKIKSLAPPVSKPLLAGKGIEIKAKISYRMEESSGAIALVIQSGSGPVFDHAPTLAELRQQVFRVLMNVTQPVTKGNGQVTLKAFFRVPDDAAAISVFTPLVIEGKESTETTDSKCYKVRTSKKLGN